MADVSRSWSDTELAYFAGIIDGEGCFCLHNRGTHIFGSQLQIGNTDFRLLQWINDRFGGTVSVEKRSNDRYKTIGRWVLRSKDLDIVLPAIIPFLLVKRAQAEIILAYRATVAPVVHQASSSSDVTEHVKTERRRLHQDLSNLNKRGRNTTGTIQ